eukprot:CAMPEP_0175058776 /NCGR_PEP_ID=MMETSP0052_2-20121109/12046_1 /TAXON_ID=51329 ORGANISM="Polytomella parva, Strain SAG 63-3" /NCGR_SAMPLE_ID=MMETSP0052_2 /ASSEMBLY_ACC=CAM_ASM_000194 /LENGTH=285 /DNA_ID=CAMNT_0016324215 /DNA_START=58 /DNA_END=915 /DNA_ORIENTATION=+
MEGFSSHICNLQHTELGTIHVVLHQKIDKYFAVFTYETNEGPETLFRIPLKSGKDNTDWLKEFINSLQKTAETLGYACVEAPTPRCDDVAYEPNQRKCELTLEQVSPHFGLPIQAAAAELKISVTYLRQLCRKLGVPRWPFRKVQSLRQEVQVSSSITSSSSLSTSPASASNSYPPPYPVPSTSSASSSPVVNNVVGCGPVDVSSSCAAVASAAASASAATSYSLQPSFWGEDPKCHFPVDPWRVTDPVAVPAGCRGASYYSNASYFRTADIESTNDCLLDGETF